MATKSLTLVTALYDLHAMENAVHRNPEVYQRLFWYVATIDLPLVIYAEKKHVASIEKIIAKFQSTVYAGRKIIQRELSELPYYQYKDDLAKLKSFNNAEPVHTLNYSILTNSKVDLMMEVAKSNPYQSSHFAWIDFGISHVADTYNINWPQIVRELPQQVKLYILLSTTPTETKNRQFFYASNRGRVAAGFFSGTEASLSKFQELCDKEFKQMLKGTYRAMEEQIMAVVTTENPKLYAYAYGDYTGVLLNFCNIRRDIDLIMLNLERCRMKGLHYMATDIAKQLVTSLRNGYIRFTIRPSYKYTFFILHSGYISSYYIDRKFATYLAKITRICHHKAHRKLKKFIMDHYSNVRANLNFVNVDITQFEEEEYRQFLLSEDFATWCYLF